MHRLAGALEPQLQLPGLVALAAKVLAHEIGKGCKLGPEDRGGAMIRDRELQLVVEDQHAGR